MNDAQDDLIAHALARGNTQAEAARIARCSERTVRRRVKDSEFQDRLRRARDTIIKETSDRFTSLQARALDTLEEALDHHEPWVQLRAVSMIFDQGGRFRDRVELEARLHAVEEAKTEEEPTFWPPPQNRPGPAKPGQTRTPEDQAEDLAALEELNKATGWTEPD